MSIGSEARSEVDYSRLSPLELIRNNIETERLEIISIAQVNTEFAVIDEGHAKDLGDSMAQKRGQISPVVVRAREEDGEVRYDVIDGFHRTEGKRRRSELSIKANVLYGCTEEELYDLRILAASSVKSVQTVRLADWIYKSFAVTKWAVRGLTVKQAFSLAISDRPSSNLNLTGSNLMELKEWVSSKCRQWQKGPFSVYETLQLAENSDPNLFKQVRTSYGGKDSHAGKITPARLRAVATIFPGEENYFIQNAFISFSVENKLSADELRTLVGNVAPLIRSGMDDKSIKQLIEETYVEESSDTVVEEISSERNKRIEKVIYKPPLGDDSSMEVPLEDLEPSDEELEQLEDEKKIDDNVFFEPGRISYRPHGDRTPTDFAEPGETIAELKAKIGDLRVALEAANSNNTNGPALEWWKTAIYLTLAERKVLNGLYSELKDMDQLSRDTHMTLLQVVSAIQSAFKKRQLSEKEVRPVTS